jgi:hypothetical protein
LNYFLAYPFRLFLFSHFFDFQYILAMPKAPQDKMPR